MRGARDAIVKPASLYFARTARAQRDATCVSAPNGTLLCERGVLSEFRAARARASYWFDKRRDTATWTGQGLSRLQTIPARRLAINPDPSAVRLGLHVNFWLSIALATHLSPRVLSFDLDPLGASRSKISGLTMSIKHKLKLGALVILSCLRAKWCGGHCTDS